jgi:glycosyltransferase involved in cell wall biosynthesis
MPKKKLLFLLPNFSLIGAQKMCKIFIDSLDKQMYEIVVVSFANGGYFQNDFSADTFYTLRPKDSFLTKIFKPFLLPISIVKLANILRKEKPAIALSIAPFTNFLLLFANKLLFGKGPKIVLEEHQHLSTSRVTDPDSHVPIMTFFYNNFLGMYNHADILKVVSESSKKDFIENWNIRPEMVKVVNPPTDLADILNNLDEEPEERFFDIYEKNTDLIISLGRLEAQKDFDFLIEAFGLAYKNNTKLRLIIFGKGNKKDALQQKINDLGLEKVAYLYGFIKNPYPLYKFAKAFCLTSVWEGMPVVILEAMACKLPVISVPCPSGPDEMIVPNQTGLLVAKDKEVFAKAIETLLADEQLQQTIKENALAALNRWDIETYKNNFKNIIEV